MAASNRLAEPIPCKWISSNRNNGKILETPDNHTWNIHKKTEKKWFMHCRNRRSEKCPASITVDPIEDLVIKHNSEHNHFADIAVKRSHEIKQKQVQNAVENPTILPSIAIQNIEMECRRDPIIGKVGPQGLPKNKSIAREIQLKRKANLDCGKLPTTLANAVIPDVMKVNVDEEDWVILNEKLYGGSSCIWGFCSKAGIDALKRAELWTMDGTFEVTKFALFKQLWIVNSLTTCGESLPSAFFLLPDKKPKTYEKCLNSLTQVQIDPPKRILIDFEQSEIKALKEAYKDSIDNIEIDGCLVHFKRNIRKYLIKDCGLGSEIDIDPDLQQYLKLIWALGLVPIDEIDDAYDNYIITKIPEKEEDSLNDSNNSEPSVDGESYNKSIAKF